MDRKLQVGDVYSMQFLFGYELFVVTEVHWIEILKSVSNQFLFFPLLVDVSDMGGRYPVYVWRISPWYKRLFGIYYVKDENE